jgi:hypothetical protein
VIMIGSCILIHSPSDVLPPLASNRKTLFWTAAM